MQFYKRYTDVIAFQDKNGMIKPLFICWDNGQKYEIDKIIHVENKASIVGGCGQCFKCRINNEIRNLYYEQDKRWFLESVKP